MTSGTVYWERYIRGGNPLIGPTAGTSYPIVDGRALVVMPTSEVAGSVFTIYTPFDASSTEEAQTAIITDYAELAAGASVDWQQVTALGATTSATACLPPASSDHTMALNVEVHRVPESGGSSHSVAFSTTNLVTAGPFTDTISSRLATSDSYPCNAPSGVDPLAPGPGAGIQSCPASALSARAFDSMNLSYVRPVDASSSADSITLVQQMLSYLGLRCEPSSGVYDKATLLAVRNFQSDVGLPPANEVGPLTWSDLAGLVGASMEHAPAG